MNIAAREVLRADLEALGFDEVRFTSLDGVPETDFEAWLAAGHHADMDWLERTKEKRLDPQQVLSSARSAILLGINYRPEGTAAVQQRWAKYALYSDYHDTILRGLRQAGGLLEKVASIGRDDYRVYVDTGPVLERGWAAAAGLGWQGKNAMLISRQHGNWLFLATILARSEIPPDGPLVRTERAGRGITGGVDPGRSSSTFGLHCGTCTACLTACPTNAFPRPGWVDSRRCISYHTIENRGIIPRELRPGIGGRVFGCDVCLDVCPWNRFAQAGRSALLAARTQLVDVTLLELMGMDEKRFRVVFRQTPMKRTRLVGMLRNAVIAAGNWHESDEWHFGGGEEFAAVVTAVDYLCRHESAIVRTHAVWALHRLLGVEAARQTLVAGHAAEHDPLVIDEYNAW